MFTVIMPSHISSDYVHGAKNRVLKFHRAVKSVISQTVQNWQLVIIADGCQKTVDDAKKFKDSRITILMHDKQVWASQGLKSHIGVGALRNAGIEIADGQWICYLDTDDFFGCNHLKRLESACGDFDWIWFDSWKYNPVKRTWYKEQNSLRPFHHGTANIAHKRELPARWPEVCKYGQDDMGFTKSLQENTNFARVEGGQYFICHVPKNPLFQSYDI